MPPEGEAGGCRSDRRWLRLLDGGSLRKRTLDLTEASMTLKRGRDLNASMFYQARDEVVTIGYTKGRMKKIREYLRACEEADG